MAHDMIINLYQHDNWSATNQHFDDILNVQNLFISDMNTIMQFLDDEFPDEKGWKQEVQRALLFNKCLVAVYKNKIVGFACWDATARGYFGPIGVKEEYRGKGVGLSLLLETLDRMKMYGYGYAIVGWVGKAKHFYESAANAIEIPNSEPCNTIYKTKVQVTETDEQYEVMDWAAQVYSGIDEVSIDDSDIDSDDLENINVDEVIDTDENSEFGELSNKTFE